MHHADDGGAIHREPPTEKDLTSPATGPWLEKYCRGKADVPEGQRTRILRLIENLTLGRRLSVI